MSANTMDIVVIVAEHQRGGPVSDPADFDCCTPLIGTAMSTEQAERVAPLLKALADPVRLRLVSLIASSSGGEACVCDLNEAFDQTQATISHHLKVLYVAGVLDRDKRGVWVYYAVRPEALTAVATLFSPPALTAAGA
jgi:ArsR family transcriptional regulator